MALLSLWLFRVGANWDMLALEMDLCAVVAKCRAEPLLKRGGAAAIARHRIWSRRNETGVLRRKGGVAVFSIPVRGVSSLWGWAGRYFRFCGHFGLGLVGKKKE